jgi:hypothetical protein
VRLSACLHDARKSGPFIPLAEQLQDDVTRIQCAEQICAGDGECAMLAANAQMIKLTLDTVDLVIFCGPPLACGIVL